MSLYLGLVLVAAILGLVFTPLVTRVAAALGLVDAPGGRKVHPSAVPRVGGLAIVAAAIVAWMTVPRVDWFRADLPPGETASSSIVAIVAGSALVLIVGLLDDLRSLPAGLKLSVQIIAALVVMASGLLIERITIGDSTWRLGLLAWPLTLLWIVGLTNAFNLIDGVDGLAAGVSIIAAATCAAILFARGHYAEAMLLTTLAGAALGFLVYNFAPATIFLGDGGSFLFGFVLATTAIAGWQKGATALAAGVPLLIFALPIADAASALARRTLRGARAEVSLRQVLRRIVEPDREHIHHRLLALGWSPRRTVVLLYVITMFLAALALATVRFS